MIIYIYVYGSILRCMIIYYLFTELQSALCADAASIVICLIIDAV